LEALPGYAEAALLIADAETARGDFLPAVEVLADLLIDDPYHLEALLRLGEVLLPGGRENDAVVALRRVLRGNPGSAVGWLRVGEAYLAVDAEDDAVACWRRALEAGLEGETADAIRDELARRGSSSPAVRRTA